MRQAMPAAIEDELIAYFALKDEREREALAEAEADVKAPPRP